ncbi:MAG: LysR family transcriptional regulator [Alphaproteobacteria bacterium]|nr:LysR family transcriptional regulator [Alphaproteobacteria bacterium]MBU1513344.1 LysR family transcriptional regulator [Alphaproteobacteria bacterium]MBU2096336.1 LysR family transcriptional regulator [Alphaproteobacteria bacterium]MBU2149972.1 LysR family transcriptional regulator [Alphaproteobacteria bacterium]MBU2309830.1 LysR family transcriptional regulator [Alphaproteobacteria bacterium]
MSDRLPPLPTLRAFEAVVRLGSVSRAAETLGRTHGAVSKQIRALQDHAGVAFFEKAGTGLRPTSAGTQLAAAVGQAFAALSQAYEAVAPPARTPSVHVACSATFATRWLAPHLGGFARAHPQIRVRLSMTSAREMRHETDADLIVLWDWLGYPEADRTRAIRLGDAAFVPVAAPGYPARIDASGVLSAPCRIVHEHTSRAWDLWARRAGRAVAAASVMAFPHSHLCIEAATAGLGVALVEVRLVERDLGDGRLVALGAPVSFDEGFAAIPHGARPLSPPARLFVDWLAAELGPPPALA